MVAVSLERALIEHNFEVWKKVEQMLLSDHNATFSDCFEHPEYLKDVLERYYPELMPEIIRSMKIYLGEFFLDEFLLGFLEKLEKHD